MSVTLLYFARLRERFGLRSESLPLPLDGASVAELLDQLRARGAPWSDELAAGRAFRIAVNHEIADPARPLQSGDEVAIFPPVTGG